jgi:hypothetical protein
MAFRNHKRNQALRPSLRSGIGFISQTNQQRETMKTEYKALGPVKSYKRGERIRTRAGKIAFVLEDSAGMAIVNVRFLDKKIAQIPARFIMGDK